MKKFLFILSFFMVFSLEAIEPKPGINFKKTLLYRGFDLEVEKVSFYSFV